MKSSFFVTLHTGQNYPPDEYTAAAGSLVTMFNEVFDDPAVMESTWRAS